MNGISILSYPDGIGEWMEGDRKWKHGGPHVAMLWKRLESACLDCACDTVRGTKTWICSKTRKSMSSPWL